MPVELHAAEVIAATSRDLDRARQDGRFGAKVRVVAEDEAHVIDLRDPLGF